MEVLTPCARRGRDPGVRQRELVAGLRSGFVWKIPVSAEGRWVHSEMSENELSELRDSAPSSASFTGVSRRRESYCVLSSRRPRRLGQLSHLPHFTDWPAGKAPAELGALVARAFAARPLLERAAPPELRRAEAYAFYGAAAVARLLRDDGLRAGLIRKFEPLLDWAPALVPARLPVADGVFGLALLELGMDGDDRLADLGLRLADAEWSRASREEPGARDLVEELYGLPVLELQAYRLTRDPLYLDRAAGAVMSYLDRLEVPLELGFATPAATLDACRNGWAAAGMTEVLRELPDPHPARGRVLDDCRLMLATLSEWQDARAGRTSAEPVRSSSDLCGSALCTYAMAEGVRSGWLALEQWGLGARSGWLGVCDYLDALGSPAAVSDGFAPAPVLFSAAALLR
jgi:hypothetical protein